MPPPQQPARSRDLNGLREAVRACTVAQRFGSDDDLIAFVRDACQQARQDEKRRQQQQQNQNMDDDLWW